MTKWIMDNWKYRGLSIARRFITSAFIVFDRARARARFISY